MARYEGLVELTNICCVCGIGVFGVTNGIPNYYCPECLSTWIKEIEAGKECQWLYSSLLVEKNRRKRRNRLMQRGFMSKNGDLPFLDALYSPLQF